MDVHLADLQLHAQFVRIASPGFFFSLEQASSSPVHPVGRELQ